MRARPAIPRAGFIIVNTIALWVATAIAVVAIWPIYRGPQILVLAIVTTAVGSLIAIAGAVFRWSSAVIVLSGVGAFLILGVPLAVPTSSYLGLLPTPRGLIELLAGVALGWKQLLTISLPVGDYQSLLVPFFVLILALTLASLSVALRAKFGELAVIGPIILVLAAIIFGPTRATFPVAVSLGLLGTILLWIVWRRWYRRRAAIRALAQQSAQAGGERGDVVIDSGFVGFRTFLGATLILVIAGGTAVGAAFALPPAGARDVLRAAVEQPFEPRNYASPLTGFRNYWQQPAVDSVLLAVHGLPKGSRLRVATLDTYDGVVFSVGSDLVNSASGSFSRVPYAFDQTAVSGTQTTIDVQVETYTGVWLPTIGDFESVTFGGSDAARLRDSFYYNNTAETAAVIGGVRTGDRYVLSAIVPRQPSESELATLVAGSASVPAPGVLPAELSVALNGYVSGADSQGQKLVAMLTGLKTSGYISHGISTTDPPSRSGHGADRINQLLTDPRMIGDAEQYAVTAALMARELGFPSRVVLGFVPESTGGISEIHGRDVSAWIEVNTSQYGWVTIDPTPPVRPIPAEVPKDPNKIARPQSVIPPAITEPQAFDRQSSPETQQTQPPSVDAILQLVLAVARVVGWVGLGLAIVLSPFLVIIGAKVRRRRFRMRAPGTVEQISGGWRELEDSIVDHGYNPPPAATRSEVAATIGGGESRVLAAVADRAVFSTIEPDAEEADRFWRTVQELVAGLDEGKSRWHRIRARISVRSLGGYSVKKLFKR